MCEPGVKAELLVHHQSRCMGCKAPVLECISQFALCIACHLRAYVGGPKWQPPLTTSIHQRLPLIPMGDFACLSFWEMVGF
jgi:hypothetical protein